MHYVYWYLAYLLKNSALSSERLEQRNTKKQQLLCCFICITIIDSTKVISSSKQEKV